MFRRINIKFEEALELVKAGKLVRRSSWIDNGRIFLASVDMNYNPIILSATEDEINNGVLSALPNRGDYQALKDYEEALEEYSENWGYIANNTGLLVKNWEPLN